MSIPLVDGILVDAFAPGEMDWDAAMNQNLVRTGLLLARAVLTVGVNDPSTLGVQVDNNRHIVGTVPIGDWAGHANEMARRDTGAWVFFVLPDNIEVLNIVTSTFYKKIAGVWSAIVLTPGAHAPTHLPAGSDPLLWGTTAGIHGVGTLAARPAAAAANANLLYFATDDAPGGRLYRSNGAVWTAISPHAREVTTLRFPADSLDSPLTADWAINALAPASADTVNSALTVRRYDDTTEEGAGFQMFLPADAIQLQLYFKSRAQTAPPGVRTVGLKLYYRQLPDNAAAGAWNSLILTDISIPTNATFQNDSQLILFSAFSPALVAGNYYQFELTRVNPTAGTELVGDWNLWNLIVEMS